MEIARHDFFLFIYATLSFLSDARVYKKVSTNGKLVLYLINRDLVITKGTVSPLHAVVTVEADELRNKKVRHM